jgi:hypothetical protein
MLSFTGAIMFYNFIENSQRPERIKLSLDLPFHLFLLFYQNVLTFTPPGFKQALNVKFPDSRLPVCVSCKKNFKTKDMCRVRNQHTRPPWTTAYICLTLDESCTDQDGKYVDKPFVVRMVQWRPFSVMEDFPPNSKTPVCATCKKTNRTRSFCRDRHKHRKLPWCTVYVMLSTQESADPSTVVAAPSRKIQTAKDTDEENNKGKMNASTPPSTKKESAVETQRDTHQLSGITAADANEESIATGKNKMNASDVPKDSSTVGGNDINDIPESRTMLIQINDEETTISWLQLSHDDDSMAKGVWSPQPQVAPQQPKCIPPGTTLLQSAQGMNYSYPHVAPATVRVAKRDAESTMSIEASHDAYHQHAMGGYTTATGQQLAPALQHPYSYHPITTSLRKDGRTPPQYSAHIWPYPTAAIPPQQRQNIHHQYVTAQQRPISPAPAIGSPGGPMIGASSPSPSVTAGEAAAMRRKKPRRDNEGEDNPNSQYPYPSPPPVPIVLQLHHQPVNYGQVQLAPGPPQPPGQPQIHQQPHYPLGQIHQEQQPWMVYQQMYQAQLQPMKNQYTNDPSVMTVRTPESASRNFHQHDESPNNVTMTPGPGDGGGDHDSDDNDFNRQVL